MLRRLKVNSKRAEAILIEKARAGCELLVNPLKIRRYTHEDLEDMVRVCNEALRNSHSCWPYSMALEWFVGRFRSALDPTSGAAFIAEDDEELLGCILLSKVNRPLVALASGIFVVPCSQRKGIGSRLMKKAIE
jgi:predicted N-acetyltransferase YhbS